ncbi:hypothetical protein BvRS1_27010 [Burkholderia vietnamiensis]|nr:hypothetical protein BvRS1_27010 [Burkholderia vietnamiensis]
MTRRPAAGRAEWNERSHAPGVSRGDVRAAGAAGRAARAVLVAALRLTDAAGFAVLRFGRVLVAAASRSKGRSQRLDFFLGMDESRVPCPRRVAPKPASNGGRVRTGHASCRAACERRRRPAADMPS